MIRDLLTVSFRNVPGSRAPLVLPVVSFAVVTALFLTIIGGAQRFWSYTDDLATTYQFLATVALMLLLVPLASLGGAAARLSARRRDERLATFRLLGAPATTVGAVTVIESTALALIGSIIGAVASLGILPLISLVHFRGEALGINSVMLAPWIPAVVVAGMTLLAGVSAALGLRSVIISPLGVRTRQDAPRLSWARLVIGAIALIVGFAAISLGVQVAPDTTIAVAFVVVSFSAALLVLNLIGPLVLGKLANRAARKASTPARLIAARRTTEDPRAAWRQVAGLSMTSFMAVFAGTAAALFAEMPPETGATMGADVQTGLVITVLGSFLMVACSAGVSQAADILDRRELSRSLTALGMNFETLNSSRVRSVMTPVLFVTVGSAAIAATLLFPLVGITLIVAPLSLVVIAALLSVGTALVWGGLRATTPLLAQTAVAV